MARPQRQPEPKPQLNPQPAVAAEAAELAGFVLGREQEMDAYRVAYQNSGKIDDWNAFKLNYDWATDTAARDRLYAEVKQYAYDTGMALPNEVLASRLAEEAAAGRAAPNQVALLTAAAKAPITDDDNGDDIIQRSDVLSTLAARALDLADSKARNKEIYEEVVRTKGGVARGIAATAVEIVAPQQIPALEIAWGALGLPPRTSDTDGQASVKVMADYIRSLQPSEQTKAIEKIVAALDASPLLMDFTERDFLSNLVQPDGTVNADGLSQAFEYFNTAFDVGAGLGLLKLPGKLIKLGKNANTMRSLLRANPKAAANYAANVAAEYSTSSLGQRWSLTRDVVLNSQLPKPRIEGGTIDVMPDGVVQAAERAAVVRGEIEAIDSRLRSSLFTPKEAVSAFERQARNIEEVMGSRIRPAMSRASLFADGTGIKFQTVLGRNDTNGYALLGTARKEADRMLAMGEKVKILRANAKGELVPADELADTTRGDFYLQLEQDVYVRPEDKALFGFAPVASGSWLGRAGRWLLDPASQFDPQIYHAYLNAKLGEAALASKLDAVAEPIFRNLGAREREAVGSMWMWAEDFGTKNNRLPSNAELVEAFPDASPEMLGGFRQLQFYYDTVYEVQNVRLRRDWAGRGFRTVRNGDTAYHGAPQANPGRKVEVLDLDTLSTVTLTKAELDELYGNGGSLLKLDAAVETADGSAAHTLVAANRKAGWQLKPLEDRVLKYVPGYSPRIYKDGHFIQRVSTRIVDGKEVEHATGVSIASTRGAAESFAQNMNRKNTNAGVFYRVADDTRLTRKDRTAMDLDVMRTEGRLFFDTRNQKRLYNINGNPAEVIDPINMLNRTSRMVARQMGSEDLVKSFKAAWRESYGDLYPGNFEAAASSAVDDALKELTNIASGDTARRANDARAMWDYIRLMESGTVESGALKRQAIRAGEWLSESLGGRFGSLELARNAHRFSPIESLKTLAYFTFLVTTPARQLVLQSAQLSFIAPLLAISKRPDYLARWHLDTTLLMAGAKSRAVAAAGGKTAGNKWKAVQAKLMGLSFEEFNTLIREFENSGLLQSVNIHSFLGDVPKGRRVTPEGVSGRARSAAFGVLTARPVRAAAEKYGFELGEQFNLSGSYMAAVRLFQQNSGKNIAQFTSEDWKQITTRASDLALGMNRANVAKFQYGAISLPLQFLSFTHKTALVMLKAVTGGKIGPRTWTTRDAQKVLAGQILLFGGAGLGLKPEIEDALAEVGVTDPTVIDIVAGGMVDYVLDKSFQAAVDDPELDLAFDEFLAPGANIINTVRRFTETAFETPVGEFLQGPAAEPLSGIAQAVALASSLTFTEDLPYSEAQKVEIVSNAFLSGLAAGYSNYMKARAAMKAGQWLSSTGDPTGVEAKWSEVVARGLLGLDTDARLDTFRIRGDLKENTREIDEATEEYYKQVTLITNLYLSKEISGEDYQARLAMHRAFMESLDPEERNIAMQKFQSLLARDRGRTTGIEYEIARAMTQGMVPTRAMRERIANSAGIAEDQKRAALEWIDRTIEQAEATGDAHMKRLDEELERTK